MGNAVALDIQELDRGFGAEARGVDQYDDAHSDRVAYRRWAKGDKPF